MSITNRKSSRKFKRVQTGVPEKPVSRFQPGSGKHLRAKPTTRKKAEQ